MKTEEVSRLVVKDGPYQLHREVTALFRVHRPAGDWVDYTENRFLLGRDSSEEPWMLWRMETGPVRSTGR